MKASRRWGGKYCGTQRQSHFWISLEFSLKAKCKTRFIKKFSQLNGDIRSYRCKDFNLKQISGLMGGAPDPTPGSATALVLFDILSTAFGNSNTLIASYRCTFWTWKTTIINGRYNKRSMHGAPQARRVHQLVNLRPKVSYLRFHKNMGKSYWYSPKLVLFHKCFSAQHGRISSLLPKCAGQNYMTWHALHDCTESWFACGS